MTIRLKVAGATCVACVIAGIAGSSAQAEECHPLTLVTSVDLVMLDQGSRPLVPVTIKDKPKLMLLDTGGAFSTINSSLADELGLLRLHGNFRLYNFSNEYSSEYVRPPFRLGTLTADHLDLVIEPGQASTADDERFAGTLAPDVMKRFDVDLDFGAGKLNLISPEHCEGKVIYWQTAAVAVVPMTVVVSGHIIIPVKLDGHATYALVDTGAPGTSLMQVSAVSTYGLTLGAADTPSIGAMPDRPNVLAYRHKFKSLEFEGISVSNPQVNILPNATGYIAADTAAPTINSHIPDPKRNESQATMLIGMNVLRHFHIYFAYREQKLYITPATQPTVPAGPTTPAATGSGQ